jgi:hypothetical protein
MKWMSKSSGARKKWALLSILHFLGKPFDRLEQKGNNAGFLKRLATSA